EYYCETWDNSLSAYIF
nr:immunoglobulin light chain junction region [Macaca mulatta]